MSITSDLEGAHYGELGELSDALREVDRLQTALTAAQAEIERLKNDSPGTPLGRFKFMSDWAHSQPWCDEYSAQGWEGQLIEYVTAAQSELTQLRARNDLFDDVYETAIALLESIDERLDLERGHKLKYVTPWGEAAELRNAIDKLDKARAALRGEGS